MHAGVTEVVAGFAMGLAIIRAMVAGEREPVRLARFRDPRWVSSTEELAKALAGPYRPD